MRILLWDTINLAARHCKSRFFYNTDKSWLLSKDGNWWVQDGFNTRITRPNPLTVTPTGEKSYLHLHPLGFGSPVGLSKVEVNHNGTMY
jgi:hypothetical protein